MSFCCWFLVDSTVVGGHTLHNFSSFKFRGLFYGPRSSLSRWIFYDFLKKMWMFSVFLLDTAGCVVWMSNFFVNFLSSCGDGSVEFSNFYLDLPISPFNSISLCFMCLRFHLVLRRLGSLCLPGILILLLFLMLLFVSSKFLFLLWSLFCHINIDTPVF